MVCAVIPAGAHHEPVAAVSHIEIGNRRRRWRAATWLLPPGPMPARTEETEARRTAVSRRALCETRDRHPAASTTQSAPASRRAPPARRGSPLHVTRCRSNVRLRRGSIRHRESRRAVPCYRTYAYRLTGSGPRSFSKRALDTCVPQLLPEHGESLVQTRFYGTQRAVQRSAISWNVSPWYSFEDDCRALLSGSWAMALPTARPIWCRETRSSIDSEGRPPGQLDDVDPLGRLDDRRPALAPNPVAAEIQRDPIEP